MAIKQLEEFFLKIFKLTVLLVMGLALIAIIFFVATAVYQYSQSPKEPAPAKIAPEKTISFDELKTYLIEQEKHKNSEEVVPNNQQNRYENQLLFLEDATSLFRCTGKFAKDIGAEVEQGDEAQLLENTRRDIEYMANDQLRGEPWVKAAVAFTCKVLADNSIIK